MHPVQQLLDSYYAETNGQSTTQIMAKGWFYFDSSHDTFIEVYQAFHHCPIVPSYPRANVIISTRFDPLPVYLEGRFTLGLLVNHTNYLPFLYEDLPRGKVILRIKSRL